MELKLILESLLFSAQKPLSVKELRDVLAAAAGHEAADATAKSLAKVKESELTAGWNNWRANTKPPLAAIASRASRVPGNLSRSRNLARGCARSWA